MNYTFLLKCWHFMHYITPRVEHFLTEIIVNVSIITLRIQDHYTSGTSGVGISAAELQVVRDRVLARFKKLPVHMIF